MLSHTPDIELARLPGTLFHDTKSDHIEVSKQRSPAQAGSTFEEDTMHRGLKSRHIQLIALGGTIGTGLFVGSGRVLAGAGPLGALLAYLVIAVIVFAVINSMGEMMTWLPLPGAVPLYTSRYVDPSLAFASGWNYWYAFAMLVCAEISAATIVIHYWTTSVNDGVWIAVFLLVITLLNLCAVKYFGETEFWFASLKIILILVLLITSFVIGLGGGPNGDRLGFRYWKHPGAINEYLVDGTTGRFLAFFNSLVSAGFAFIFGPEMVCIAAGESASPRRNLPKATRRFFWRIVLFYIGGVLAIGCIVSSDTPGLVSGTGNANSSPFVLGIKNAGISGLPHFINATILASAWSSGNAFMYAGSRTLHALAMQGSAPRILRKLNKQGVPIYCVLVMSLIGLLTFMNLSDGGSEVFGYFVNLSTISGFTAWIILLITYLRFRAAYQAQGIQSSELPFKSPFQPYLAWFGLVSISVITFFNGFAQFFPGKFTVSGFLTAYFGLPYLLVLYLGHKLYTALASGFKATRWYIPAGEIDILSGKKDIDEDEAATPERIPCNALEKVWFWIA